MHTLLVEHGAGSGFLVAFYHFFHELSSEFPQTHPQAVSISRHPHLAPEATMSIRLDVPAYSDRSRTGDPISATVPYPLCRDGEQLACKPGELPLVRPQHYSVLVVLGGLVKAMLLEGLSPKAAAGNSILKLRSSIMCRYFDSTARAPPALL